MKDAIKCGPNVNSVRRGVKLDDSPLLLARTDDHI